MTLTVEAIYENGVLKPAQPLPLKEHEHVQLTIRPTTSWVQETFGICGWKGSREEADREPPTLGSTSRLPRNSHDLCRPRGGDRVHPRERSNGDRPRFLRVAPYPSTQAMASPTRDRDDGPGT
jgi:predicted DNA-binding antitoxin AbrB/MazE fold protein